MGKRSYPLMETTKVSRLLTIFPDCPMLVIGCQEIGDPRSGVNP
jgi:hypothetical protein